MIAEWKFELIVSATMQRIGQIKQARSRQVQLLHNRAGGCSFTVPLEDEMFSGIEPWKHGVVAYRNDEAEYSGPIVNLNETLGGNRMAVSSAGWFELLNRRKLRRAISYPRLTSPPTNITGGGIVFDDPVGTPNTATYYPGGLLTIANAQRDTWIVEGSNSDVMQRAISYEQGQSIGEAITALSDTEAGFDFRIDPLTRVMNITNWDQYTDKTSSVYYGFNFGPNNLRDVGRQIDGTVMNNRHTALGSFGGGFAEDLDSQATYQLFEEYSSIDSTDPNVLLAYAGSEVILRGVPRVIYTINPFPYFPGRTPQPFVDFHVGDMILFSAIKPPRVQVEEQRVRVFGMTVNITEEGNEKIDSLQVTPG